MGCGGSKGQVDLSVTAQRTKGDASIVISTDELAKELGKPTLKVLDASAEFGRKEGDCPRVNFLKNHITGAQFMDLEYVKNFTIGLPYMLPAAETDYFKQCMQRLGVALSDQVVVYDTSPMNLFGYRAAWMLQAMGHTNVRVLDGGFQKWTSEGKPTESTDSGATNEDFAYKLKPSSIKHYDQIKSPEDGLQIIDMRTDKEREEGVIPGGNEKLPVTAFINFKEGGQMLSLEDRKKACEDAELDMSKDTCVSCNRGISATAAYFGMKEFSSGTLSVYDGSWMEWKSKA